MGHHVLLYEELLQYNACPYEYMPIVMQRRTLFTFTVGFIVSAWGAEQVKEVLQNLL